MLERCSATELSRLASSRKVAGSHSDAQSDGTCDSLRDGLVPMPTRAEVVKRTSACSVGDRSSRRKAVFAYVEKIADVTNQRQPTGRARLRVVSCGSAQSSDSGCHSYAELSTIERRLRSILRLLPCRGAQGYSKFTRKTSRKTDSTPRRHTKVQLNYAVYLKNRLRRG
tara:strand:- start:58 stop:564 length:507 start_codon:yes stop_codon:yes gene_type:complete